MTFAFRLDRAHPNRATRSETYYLHSTNKEDIFSTQYAVRTKLLPGYGCRHGMESLGHVKHGGPTCKGARRRCQLRGMGMHMNCLFVTWWSRLGACVLGKILILGLKNSITSRACRLTEAAGPRGGVRGGVRRLCRIVRGLCGRQLPPFANPSHSICWFPLPFVNLSYLIC